MTDRIKGLTVTLAADMREDDAEEIINAIRLMRGVIHVTGHVASLEHHLAVTRAKQELLAAIHDLLK